MKISLKHVVLGAVALAAVAVMGAFTVANVAEVVATARAHSIESARRLATVSAPVVLTALVVGDLNTAEESLEALSADEALATVALLDAAGRTKVLDIPPRSPLRRDAAAWLRAILDVRFDEIRVPLAAGGVGYGAILVTPSAHLVENAAWERVRAAIFEMALLLVVLVLVTERLLSFGLRPLALIAETAKRFGDGDYAVRMRPTAITEVRQLAASFNTMADSLEHAMRELGANEAGLRRAIRESEIANRSKSEFLANMSHELRTPLNAIIGFSSVMKEEMFGPLTVPKYRDYAASILESGEHLLAIINDLLDVSAIEADRLQLHLGPTDTGRVAQSAIRLVAPRAEASRVTLRSEIDRSVPVIQADERRLKQILLNLLTNAVKFTPAGGLVELTTRLDANGDVQIAIRDTGIGMDKRGIATALERFGQVDAGLNRRQEGVGLGLPLTKGLVELHRGTFSIDSTPGSGTVVTVTLPCDRAAAPASAA